MKYTPYTEAEIQSMNVMEAGVYTFQVIDVDTTKPTGERMVDKNGNDMAKLKLVVWDSNDRERTIFTYISGDGNFAYKFRHFAKSIDMIAEYEAGTFDIRQTVGKSGMADVVVKKGTLKQDGSGDMWPDRNDVKDFVAVPQSESKAPAGGPPAGHPASVSNLDDDIAF
jgi:hypothetical protein